jgi:hypothetical protein
MMLSICAADDVLYSNDVWSSQAVWVWEELVAMRSWGEVSRSAEGEKLGTTAATDGAIDRHVATPYL